MAGNYQSGEVKWYDKNKGYGFIKPDSGNRDIFVHVSAVRKAGLIDLTTGQRISFQIETKREKEKDKDTAINLVLC